MQRTSSLAFTLFLALTTSIAFPQQMQSETQLCETEKCAACVPEKHGYGFSLPEHPVVRANEAEHPFPARGGEVDWGLALSGGGLRSSAFNIGVMKFLYDEKILDKIDVISSVSGGSYASYWLFTSYHRDTNRKFGLAAFDPEVFIKNMCEFQGRGNFFTNKRAIRAVIKSDIDAFRDYENAIIRSFGNREPFTTQVDEYDPLTVKKKDAPYLIINATLNSDALGGLGKVFEITPTHMGNPVVGFYKWKENGGVAFRFSESVTMSGAALDWKLKRKIPNFAPHIINTKELELSDGGHSENLGALALIRRGVKNIIVTDAEHDYDYKFEAYWKLKKLLDGMGIEFCVPDIENFKKDQKSKSAYKSAVSIGHAKSWRNVEGVRSINSKIFYVKMSRPQKLFPYDNDAECRKDVPTNDRTNDCDILDNCLERTANVAGRITPYEKGECLRVSRNNQAGAIRWVYSPKGTAICRDRCWNCDRLAGFDLERDMYVHIVQRYSYWLNCKSKSKYLPKLFSSKADFRYKFPQITTWDQDYYRDQLEAFVGLGYLQASELP